LGWIDILEICRMDEIGYIYPSRGLGMFIYSPLLYYIKNIHSTPYFSGIPFVATIREFSKYIKELAIDSDKGCTTSLDISTPPSFIRQR
jgi:hypothetical protein